MRFARIIAGAVAGAWLVAACTVLGPREGVAIEAAAEAPFGVEGRLSARRGSDAVAVSFAWRHDPPRDTLTVSSPLGQVLAELEGDASAGRVVLTLAGGRIDEADDWASLTERALGFPLPVASLSAWVRGLPHPGSAFAVDGDGAGRAAAVRQDGWSIAYSYADDIARRPERIRLQGPDTEVRIVVDRWL